MHDVCVSCFSSAVLETNFNARVMFEDSRATPGSLIWRGRGKRMQNSPQIRPGWEENKMTLSPRHTASRTL